MATTAPDQSPSLARYNMTACIRCRQKKKRCDQKLPRCGLCEVAQVECVNYDAVARRRVPRSYVLSLESRVAHLELKLQERGVHDDGSKDARQRNAVLPPSSTAVHSSESSPMECATEHLSQESTGNVSDAAARATLDRVLSLAQRRPEDEPAFSKILLAELMKSKATPRVVCSRASDEASVEKHPPSDMLSDLDTSPVSLPTKEGAHILVKAYFQFANLGMPLLHEPTFRQKLDVLYAMTPLVDLAEVHTSSEARIAVFFVFEVFAVALLTMQKKDPSRIPTSLADRYHKTALRALDEAGLPNDVEGVQALLLVGQYSYHHPTTWPVWKTIGAALRLAVELGLHRDAPSGELDFLTLDTMRRTFWVAYSMDRNVSIALGMPSCLSDGAITAKFPSLLNDEFILSSGPAASEGNSFWPKSISFHLFRYRLIQSEMQAVLYERQPPACHLRDLNRWQQEMRERIYAWHDSIPRADGLTDHEQKVIGNFELTFHRALLYLYHPSLSIPSPSQPALLVIADAATNIIHLYRRLFVERTLTIYWQAVENLSSAGTALMSSYVNSRQVREQLTFRSLESLVRTCSSVLWGMVEHFPAFKGKRDAFDIVASKTLADLAPNLSGEGGTEKLMQGSMGIGQRSSSREHVQSLSSTLQQGQQQLSVADRQAQPPFADASGFEGRTSYQYTGFLPPATAGGPSAYNPDGPFLLSDLDGMSFDSEALGTADGVFPPMWD